MRGWVDCGERRVLAWRSSIVNHRRPGLPSLVRPRATTQSARLRPFCVPSRLQGLPSSEPSLLAVLVSTAAQRRCGAASAEGRPAACRRYT